MSNLNEQLNNDVLPQQEQNVEQKNEKINRLVNVLLIIAIVFLVCTIVVKSFFVTNVKIKGASMMETLQNNQKVIVHRNVDENNLQRGKIVVFYVKHPGWIAEHFGIGARKNPQTKLYIKRAVALQGDKIWVEAIDNDYYKLVVQTPNGDILYEDYYTYKGEKLPQESFKIAKIKLGRLAEFTKEKPYVVPNGCFFVLGDNRGDSEDSRGYVVNDAHYENLFGIVKD